MSMRRLAGLMLLPVAVWAQQPPKQVPASVPSINSKSNAPIKTPSQILDENRSSIAVIVAAGNTSLKLGTGFFVRSTGLLLTNFHVVEGTDVVGVRTPGSDEVVLAEKATGFDLDNDLVLLEVEAKGTKPVALGDSDQARVGEQVVVIGNPAGLEQSVSNGLLSGIRELDGRKLFQISAPISEGSSGSPVFNSRGEVIAIVVSSLESGQNLNFAVPINYTKPLLSLTTREEISALPKRSRSDAQPGNGNPSVAPAADPAKLAVQAMSKIADEIRACPESVSIRKTSDKKAPFYALHEGPPANVRFDVQSSESLVAPFQGIVEFSTEITSSRHAKTPEQAASDPERDYYIVGGISLKTQLHRYFYRINGSEVQLDHRARGTPYVDKWSPEPDQPDQCWQLVGYK